MRAPGLAVLAILGGIGWSIWPIPQAMVGRTWPAGEAVSVLLFFSVVGGAWILAWAIIGLAVRAGDKISPAVAALASICAALGAVSVLGAYALVVGLPIGSAVLLWALSRAGLVGAWLSRAHVAAAALLLLSVGILLTNNALYEDRAIAVPLMALAIPYGLSWIAIGWSLGHVASVAEGGTTGST